MKQYSKGSQHSDQNPFILCAAGSNTAASLLANLSSWMIIPTNLVSQTGDDCDLVGTSFAAFRNQVVGDP